MNSNIPTLNNIPVSLTNIFLASSIIFTPVSVQKQENNRYSNYSMYSNENYNYYYCEPIKIDNTIEVEKKINSIRTFEKNWDGYNGDIPEETVLNNSLKFLYALPESIQVELSTDRVVLTPYGTIVFDFENNNNILSIEIGEKNIGFFTDFTDNKNYNADKIVFNPNKIDEKLAKAFNKLYEQTI